MSIIHLPGAPETVVDTVMRIVDPRDGTPVGDVDPATPEDVDAALDRARDTAAWWARVAPAERGSLLRHAAAALADHAATLARLNARETGRPEDEALAGVTAGVETLLQYAELGPLHRGASLRGAVEASDYTVAEPRGVVVALTPWNDPVAVAAGLVGAAVVTGNVVVHKPSERCPHTGAFFGDVLARALPDGVVQTLQGGSGVGSALVAHPAADVVAHVGSTATGRSIARSAAERGAHTVLENGGDDPLLVDAGVDPRWAAQQAATGAFANVGQICTSVERVYVHRGVAEPFVAALVEEARRRAADLGPLVDERLRSAVHDQVQQAVAAGARVLTGGEVPVGPGTFYPPTVLVGCTPDMAVVAEETFGPVAPVMVVDSFEEGLSLASSGRYGLAATVLTPSLAHAHQAVAALPVGTVKVNAVFGGAPGGSAEPRGDSGHGLGYGPGLLDEMTAVKVVHLEAAPPVADAAGEAAGDAPGSAASRGGAGRPAGADRPAGESAGAGGAS